MLRRPNRHKNEGSTLLSKIIFDCATKAGIECVVKDGVGFYGVIPQGHMCTMHRHHILFCTAYLDKVKLTIDFRPISAYLDSRISPKYWHILVRPDTMDCQYEVDINDPQAFNDLVELFVALRPISNSRPNNSL